MIGELAPQPRSEISADKLRPFTDTTAERRALLEKMAERIDKAPRSFRRLVRLGQVLLGLGVAFSAAREMNVTQSVEAALKFQGLRVYASIYQYDMTGDFLNHFLSRSGEPLDITHSFPRAISQAIELGDLYFPPDMGIDDESDPTELIKAFVQTQLPENYYGDGRNPGHSYTYGLTSSVDGDRTYVTDLSDPELVGQPITFIQIQRSFSDDTTYALGAYTMTVSGIITAIDPDQGTVTLADTTVRVQDHYDWQWGQTSADEGTDQLNVSTNVGTVLDTLGVGIDFPEWVTDMEIMVNDRDGQQLVDAGLAAEFDVSGEWSLGDLTLFRPQVELPPEDVE